MQFSAYFKRIERLQRKVIDSAIQAVDTRIAVSRARQYHYCCVAKESVLANKFCQFQPAEERQIQFGQYAIVVVSLCEHPDSFWPGICYRNVEITFQVLHKYASYVRISINDKQARFRIHQYGNFSVAFVGLQ